MYLEALEATRMFKEVHVEDIELHAGAPQVATLLSLWRAQATETALPPYSAFEPKRFPELAPDLAVVEALGQADYRYIYYGRAIAAESGVQMLGSRVSDRKSEIGAFFCSVYERALAVRRPIYTVHRANHALRVHLWERLVLPVSVGAGPLRLVVFNKPREYKQDLLTAVLEASPEGIMGLRCVRTEHGQIVDALVLTANQRMAEIIGYCVADLIDRPLLETIPALRDTKIWEHCVEVVESRRPQRFEFSFKRRDATLCFNVRIVPLGDGVTVSVSEITNLKDSHRELAGRNVELARANGLLRRQAKELRAAEEAAKQARCEAERAARDAELARGRLLTAFDVVPEALVLFDSEDRYLLWNRSYADIYAESGDAIAVGARFEDVLRAGVAKGLYPEAVGREEAWLAERIARQRAGQSSHERQLHDGRWVRIEERRTADGGAIGVRVDITELKRREEALREQNARFDAAINNMSEGLCLFDGSQRLIVCNKRYIEMYELDVSRIRPGVSLREIIDLRCASGSCPAMSAEQYHAWRNNVALNREPSHTVVELMNGKTFEIRHRPMPDGGWVATHADITERRRVETALEHSHKELERQNALLSERERQLREQNARFEAAINNMSQGLCMTDAELRLVVCNRRYAEIYGLNPERIRPGMPWSELLEEWIAAGNYGPGDVQAYRRDRFAQAASKVPSSSIQELNDGRLIAIVHQPMADGGAVATHEDITERRRMEERIVHMAHHDPLTDLPNRVLLRQTLEHALTRVRCGEEAAVLGLDLDRFKEVNDSLGHAVGDALLKAVAKRLQRCVRGGDLIARLGGDEFTIVQAAAEAHQEAATLASRIIEAVASPFIVQGHRLLIGTSIGIAVAPQDGTDVDHILKNSDLALYGAKTDGRGSYRFFEPQMNARMQARRALEMDLRQALERQQFELHYQPLVDLGSNRVCGCEALLRWEHPERGRISPAEFIPVAESTGLIVPIGEWVLRQACAAAVNWPAEVKVAVNLSALQLRSADLMQVVIGALASSELAPRRLELEITESVLLNDSERTLTVVRQLQQLGVQIALDDFGTGYSSLSYLRTFPFDKIKIDRCFIGDLTDDNPSGLAILRAVTELGRSLGMRTTAEGVETQQQLTRVRAEGCTEMQGYFFSPPVPAHQLPQLFETNPEVFKAVAA
jgi:diguanylate cyclase (GGDEF)-like protein